ncbi:hypothetical protein Taro_034045 [Colocasia esculenta]|uniref:Protein kinase domain-containing protein n=1 Tax=Colocasia esculenta TaxID=4460 RepID=A0A843W1S5_COLES|nr:hypothetical protein [Colocasia esculenta]
MVHCVGGWGDGETDAALLFAHDLVAPPPMSLYFATAATSPTVAAVLDSGRSLQSTNLGRWLDGAILDMPVMKGELKGQEVAVKVIPKAKMTTAIAIEGIRREVKILSALTGHKNLVQFYDAYEDEDNAFIVMELCRGGELLDRILARKHVRYAANLDPRLEIVVWIYKGVKKLQSPEGG